MSTVSVTLPAPRLGEHADSNPRSVPPEGAKSLRNLRVVEGFARLRAGSAALYTAPNANRVFSLFNLIFNDSTVRVLRATDASGIAGATSAIHYDTGSAWAAVTLDNTFSTIRFQPYWAVVAPWGASSIGRIIISNGIKIKQWDGAPASTMADVAGGIPGKFGFVGPDNRLFVGNVVDVGTQQQEIVWTIPSLTNGSTLDWSDPGSGRLRIRNDSWPLTRGWAQYGRIFLGKTRSIVALDPTGVATDAYGYSSINTDGRGVASSASFIKYGEIAAFFAFDGFAVFDGTNVTSVGHPSTRSLLRRINSNALEYMTAIYDEDNRRIGWGIPLDGQTDPTEIWWFDVETGAWEVDSPFTHTALSLYMNVAVTYISGLVGFISGLTGTIASLSASIAPKAAIVYGSTVGSTSKFDSSLATDGGIGIQSEYISPAIRPLGAQIIIAGKPRVITEKDYLVLDEVVLTLMDMGQTYTVQVDASIDGGKSWAVLGSVTVTSDGTATDLAPAFAEKRIGVRYGIGQQIQLRLRNSTSGNRWGFADITARMDVIGTSLTK